jgi:(R)-2-hydroxyacyl-CoA dehydratese activating ATPase
MIQDEKVLAFSLFYNKSNGAVSIRCLSWPFFLKCNPAPCKGSGAPSLKESMFFVFRIQIFTLTIVQGSAYQKFSCMLTFTHGGCMRAAGIDIGSRSIELVVVEDSRVIDTRQGDTGFDPISVAKDLIRDTEYDHIVATGYGRNLFEVAFDGDTVTEIKAHARGAYFLFPAADTVLDIGGQDSKVIKMNAQGKVIKFEMNDRCAAGTGKFLEIMARSLGFQIDTFGDEALKAQHELAINSMCTVFAESEVTSLLARGEDRREIARGLHSSVVRRAFSMIKRVSDNGTIVFSGGVANNACIVSLLENIAQKNLLIPEAPQMIGALGAALISEDKMRTS